MRKLLVMGIALGLVSLVTPAAARPDTEITESAKAALHHAKGVPSRSIQLTTFEGRVILQGDVRTAGESARAEAAVRKVPGVVEVRNLLEVAPPRPPARRVAPSRPRMQPIPPTTVAVDATPIVPRDASDAADQEIRRAVVDALADVSLNESANIRVDVRDGAVRLTGTVPTWQGNNERMHAVRSVPGVRAILNELRVASLNS